MHVTSRTILQTRIRHRWPRVTANTYYTQLLARVTANTYYTQLSTSYCTVITISTISVTFYRVNSPCVGGALNMGLDYTIKGSRAVILATSITYLNVCVANHNVFRRPLPHVNLLRPVEISHYLYCVGHDLNGMVAMGPGYSGCQLWRVEDTVGHGYNVSWL